MTYPQTDHEPHDPPINAVCSCGRSFWSERGMKTHQTRTLHLPLKKNPTPQPALTKEQSKTPDFGPKQKQTEFRQNSKVDGDLHDLSVRGLEKAWDEDDVEALDAAFDEQESED